MVTNWENQYQIGETPWDKSAAHPVLESEKFATAGRWLVPGCGYGNDVAALISSGAEAVLGLDVAPSAVEGARKRYGNLKGAEFAVGDFFVMDSHPLAGQFDGIWEHTCFCAIQPVDRERYVTGALAALRPGGLLVACFYLNPWDADEDQDQGPPFRSEVPKLDELFGKYFELEREFVPEKTFPGREGKELVRFLRLRS